MTELRVPQPLAQALHDYLITQPMSQVEALVASLRQCQPIPDEEEEEPVGEEA